MDDDIRIKDVQRILDALQPAMEADGGGVELVGIEGDTVLVRMRGACLICPSLDLTLNLGITQTLQSQLSWVEKVRRVT